MNCDRCGAPTRYGAPSCGYCHSSLAWSGQVPDLAAGRPLKRWQLTDELPPGLPPDASPERHTSGVTFELGAKRMITCPTDVELRDGAVGIVGCALTPEGCFGVIGRFSRAGRFKCGYVLTARPASRSVQLIALMWTGSSAHADVILDWTVVPSMEGVGDWNDLELRFTDRILEVRVNEVKHASVVDARFGFGHVGWRVCTYNQAASVAVHQIRVNQS